MKKLFLSLLTVLLPMVAFAEVVKIDDIYYNLIAKAKVAEVSSISSDYSGNLDIPASVTYDGIEYSVTTILKEAFKDKWNLTSVSIPNSVTSIGEFAFYNCYRLESVNIPDGVTSIGRRTFYKCNSLTSITIPNSVTSIGEYAFNECYCITSITISNNLTSIEKYTFGGCRRLTSVTIPSSVTSIGNAAFAGCSALSTLNIEYGLRSIGNDAFKFCSSLTSITFPNSLSSIGEYTFWDCTSLTNITIPNSVTYIAEYAFFNCSSLTSVIIPNKITTIEKGTFEDCKGLATITIGSIVSKINERAFENCPNITDVYCLAESVPVTSNDAFQNSYCEYAVLHVPENAINSYKEKKPWNSFKSIIALDVETQICATPTISYQNGQLIFESETEGVDFVSEITDSDIKKHNDATISLTATYTITVYATKSGYEDSDVATATLCWIDQQPETEGITDGLAQIPARSVLIKTDRGQIIVEGVDDGTNINLYTTDGKLAGSAISQNGSASIDTHLPSGTTAIVKMGEKSVKVMVK